MELTRRIDALLEGDAPRVIVALDGKCATGKTTLAGGWPTSAKRRTRS